MRKLLFLLVPALAIATSGRASTIEFAHANKHYSIEKTSKEFVLRTSPVELRAKIRKCNEKIFLELWKKVVAKTKALQLTTRGSRLPAAADLTVDGEARQVLEIEPGFKFFYFLPQDATLAFIEAEKKCAK
jgi:hypothetical protein